MINSNVKGQSHSVNTSSDRKIIAPFEKIWKPMQSNYMLPYYTMSIPIPAGFPWEKRESWIRVPDAHVVS